ncbi:MarR family winged helix-turn-helix transcriptional regulator [Thermomonospora catenispora]|uniref:MarR family winged helix-turn-helix transcriptional regulator n=1 Tax=Thermomonospora catenispora TaxID=2493090 RepID=UPI00111F7F59|nr:MarR family transcriptional regulator [Thermomonospora catenispora]TNY35137.1 MarR family transcriptional regulator [Thermomonospora catenispora]
MTRTPTFGGPRVSPGYLLWRATLRWQRRIATALKPLGLTHVQYVLLESLWRFDAQGRRPSQRELADRAGTDVMMTSQVVRTLADKGLLRRTVDRRDARKRVLALTPRGREATERAMEVVARADEEHFGGVGDRRALLVLLGRLAYPEERRRTRDGGDPVAR